MILSIAQIVLDHVSFSHADRDYLAKPPNSAGPQSEVKVTINVTKEDDGKGATVRLQLVSDAPEAAYHFNISYLVLFGLDDGGAPVPPDIDKRLMVTGATMAMPFIRELVANLTSRGRFGTSWVSPTDFNQLLQNVDVTPDKAGAASP